MLKYIFENKEATRFADLTEGQKLEIISATAEGRCENWFLKRRIWGKKTSRLISLDGVYRTLNPAPRSNKIDWSRVPPQFKYCFVNNEGRGRASVKLPIERTRSGKQFLEHSGYGVIMVVSEGDHGFIRGNVPSIDSLLIRPIGS